jgi:fatty-acyl-CoA synthase
MAQPAPYYPSSVLFYDWVAHHAARAPNAPALADLATQRRFTYADLHRRADRLAAHLRHACNVRPGDRVAMLSPNCTEFFEVEFATARAGAIVLPLNWRLTPHELGFIVGDAAPTVLIHDASFAEVAAQLRDRCKVAHLIELDAGDPASAYERAIAAATDEFQPVAARHDDACMVMYTSGTTGLPKGALITHAMQFWNCANLSFPARITRRSVCLTILPLFHTGGLNCYANPILHAGGCVLVMRAFDPGETLRLIGDRSAGVTHFFGVPTNYQVLRDHPLFAETDVSRLSCSGVGAAPMPLALLRDWAEKGLALSQGYGMTETSPTTLVLDPEDAVRKAGSAGRPALHTEVRIVDPDGRDVPPGVVGELWTRGPNITPGYWNRPDANAASFTDGWLHTGDAARMDDEGFVTIVDRWKDMYISGGENVYPAEVENAIGDLPEVAEAGVIGVADARWGEVGKAFVVLRPGRTLAAEAVLAHCRTRLARFKQPVHVEFIEALPRNAGGKILKRELKAR